MASISEQKERRRERLRELLNEIPQAALAEQSQIAAAMLWQMARGAGKTKRNVSDKHARALEKAANRPLGWFDSPPPSAREAPSATGGKNSALRAADSATVRPLSAAHRGLVMAVQNIAGTLTEEQAKVLTTLIYVMSGQALGPSGTPIKGKIRPETSHAAKV